MVILFIVLSSIEAFLFLWVAINPLWLPSLHRYTNRSYKKKTVSVLVPLRNESKNVPGLIATLRNVKYDELEFILLDDQSSDDTKSLLMEHTCRDSRFTIIEGKHLPEGWNGKVHACHHLSKYSNNEVMFFIDADVRIEPNTIHHTLALMENQYASMVSGFPTYLDNKLVQFLVTMQHFVIHLHLPLFFANYTKRQATTAACGQFIAINRTTYNKIGGHEAIYNSLVEDVELGRLVKKHGDRVILANITKLVSCFMYGTIQEAWEGFTKNIFIGIGRSKIGAIGLSIFYALFYISPLLLAVYAVFNLQWMFLLPLVLTVLQKGIVDIRTRTSPFYSLGMPLSAAMLIGVLWTSMYKAITGKAYVWKGRSYQ
ncbi:glycosyltransferase [Pontibacillus yanchengensis]|uniref:Glycosyltransferase n=2 Tax=Pontibacillus yanchengensis TaxID=462910 RepID=A0ACC7VDE4_9BACI|nr:glycosyltransferase [Pontibacillus yanchengensis]MYL34783.1 glycosyltransferase [Pontibacillus yanchengensis]MYL52231.1 glycosyltransferase [Pontibacillus yanchengensis]